MTVYFDGRQLHQGVVTHVLLVFDVKTGQVRHRHSVVEFAKALDISHWRTVALRSAAMIHQGVQMDVVETEAATFDPGKFTYSVNPATKAVVVESRATATTTP